jgi:heat shock protein HslJ
MPRTTGTTWAIRALAAPAAVVLMLGLAGCGHDTVSQAHVEPQGPNTLPGSPTPTGDFLSTSVTHGGAPKTLVSGTRISLGFTDGQLRADAGCNTMSGPVRFDGGLLIVDQLAQTDMGCPDGRNTQDQFVATFLTAHPAYSYDGTNLTLSNADTQIAFGPKQTVQPDLPLEGIHWDVTHITQGPPPGAAADPNAAVSAGVAPSGAFLKFADGKLTGSDGCNSLFGDAAISGDHLTFGPIGTTKKACPGMTGMDQLRAVLTGTVGWKIDDHVLTLTNARGAGLQLQAPPDAVPSPNVVNPPCCKPLVSPGAPTPQYANDLPLNVPTAPAPPDSGPIGGY